jgi:hypothetical protein
VNASQLSGLGNADCLWTMTEPDVLPAELVETLLQQAVLLTIQSHGYAAVHPHAVSLIIETVEKRTSLH